MVGRPTARKHIGSGNLGRGELSGHQQGRGPTQPRRASLVRRGDERRGRRGGGQGAAADAHESRDEGSPFGVAQRAGWVEDLDVTVFLPVAGAVAAVVALEGSCRCGEIVEAMLQVRLVLLDLYDQIIAGRLGDLECFFDSAWRRS